MKIGMVSFQQLEASQIGFRPSGILDHIMQGARAEGVSRMMEDHSHRDRDGGSRLDFDISGGFGRDRVSCLEEGLHMTLYGLLDVLEGFFIRVAPGMAAFQYWAIRMIDVFVGLDRHTENIRLSGRLMRSCAFHNHYDTTKRGCLSNPRARE